MTLGLLHITLLFPNVYGCLIIIKLPPKDKLLENVLVWFMIAELCLFSNNSKIHKFVVSWHCKYEIMRKYEKYIKSGG